MNCPSRLSVSQEHEDDDDAGEDDDVDDAIMIIIVCLTVLLEMKMMTIPIGLILLPEALKLCF